MGFQLPYQLVNAKFQKHQLLFFFDSNKNSRKVIFEDSKGVQPNAPHLG